MKLAILAMMIVGTIATNSFSQENRIGTVVTFAESNQKSTVAERLAQRNLENNIDQNLFMAYVSADKNFLILNNSFRQSVRIEAFSLSGRRLATLVSEPLGKGTHQVSMKNLPVISEEEKERLLIRVTTDRDEHLLYYNSKRQRLQDGKKIYPSNKEEADEFWLDSSFN